ncbi:MAG: cadherin-like domain-containing protein [Oscillospiraceae bacterium]|nr:cadherin-like domain-containing protein [Oscillospiraceae bacterium]
MLHKRILCGVLCAMLCLGLAGGAIALEVDCDEVYCFRNEDFSSDTLTGICITGLPDTKSGTVMLGSRVLRCGDILTAEQLQQMTFHPLLSETDREAVVTYLPIYSDRVEKDAVMTISIRGKEDKVPVAQNSTMETYKNLPNTGKLNASDPEGEALKYTVTRQPKRGSVSISPDGSFTYTPKKNKVGTDSFTYTAADPSGKVSREATVTIEILKPTDAAQYTDTVGKPCRFAAEWMKNTGLFVGEEVAGAARFQPEKQVSRGEFLTMLVEVLGIPKEEGAQETGFTDEAPDWLKPYLAAALRCGVTERWPEQGVFGANETMEGAQAALLVQNALDLSVSTGAGKENDSDLPVWASDAITAMAENGITLNATEPLTRGDAAMLLYQVKQLKQSLVNREVY